MSKLRRGLERAVSRIASGVGYDLGDLSHVRSLAGLPQAARASAHLERRRTQPRPFFDGVLETLHAQKGNLTIVQVGANDGVVNDPVFDFSVRHPDATSLLLIEPQPDMAAALHDNYRDHPAAVILDVAIGPPGQIDLYRIRPEAERSYRGIVASGIASRDPAHVERKAQTLLPGRRSARQGNVQRLSVESVSLTEAIRRSEFAGDVDVLVIDTEGFDDEVIYSAALGSAMLPAAILYETAHLDAVRLENLRSHLSEAGYSMTSVSEEDECAVLASTSTKYHR